MNIVDPPKIFLRILSAAGLPLGMREVEQLYRVFYLNPVLDRRQLYDVLVCLLVKTPRQRDLFDTLFEQCCPERLPKAEEKAAEADLLEAPLTHEPHAATEETTLGADECAAPASEQAAAKPTPSRPYAWWTAVRFEWRRLRWLGIAFAIALLSAVIFSSRMYSPETSAHVWQMLTPGLGAWLGAAILSLRLHWSESAADVWQMLTTGLGAWLLAALAWLRYRRKQPSAGVTVEPGSLWLPLPEMKSPSPVLLESREIRRLVWSIGRFVSDDLTPKIDLPRTVDATARAAGQVAIHRRHAIYANEVWLWLDQAADDDASWRLADELESTLERAGLPCRRGVFWGTPGSVTWAEGQVLSPLSLEGHRQHAMVVILSDGRGLTTAHELPAEHGMLTQLLHGLSEWPQLAFVDSSSGVYNMEALLKRYGLRCIAPEAVPAFLGAKELPAKRHRPLLTGDLKVWAAALTLSPDPVDEDSAYAVRRALNLSAAPWDLREITALGTRLGDGYTWPLKQRAAWLNWLMAVDGVNRKVESGATPGEAVAGTQMAATLDFWRKRYYQSEQEYQQEKSQGACRFTVQRAVLDLWRHPERATEELYALHQSDAKTLSALIATHMGDLAPIDGEVADGGECIRLPWRWEDIQEEHRWMLRNMHFAKRSRSIEAGRLHAPGTVALFIGLCTGVAGTMLPFSGWLGAVVLLGLLGPSVRPLRELFHARLPAANRPPAARRITPPPASPRWQKTPTKQNRPQCLRRWRTWSRRIDAPAGFAVFGYAVKPASDNERFVCASR